MLSSETMRQGKALAGVVEAVLSRFHNADPDAMPLPDLLLLGAFFGSMSLGLTAIRHGLQANYPIQHIREALSSADDVLDRLECKATEEEDD